MNAISEYLSKFNRQPWGRERLLTCVVAGLAAIALILGAALAAGQTGRAGEFQCGDKTWCSWKTAEGPDKCVCVPKSVSVKIIGAGSLHCADNQHVEGDGKSEAGNHCVDDLKPFDPEEVKLKEERVKEHNRQKELQRENRYTHGGPGWSEDDTAVHAAIQEFNEETELAPRASVLRGTAHYLSATDQYMVTFPPPNQCVILGPVHAASRLDALYQAVSRGGFSLFKSDGGLTVWTIEEWNEAMKRIKQMDANFLERHYAECRGQEETKVTPQ